MTKKTFTWNLKDRKFNDLKAINKEILYKSYTRNFLKDDQKIKVIDNSSSISDILLDKDDSKKYRIGTSINAKTTILKSIYWDKIQIAMPFLIKPKKKSFVTKLKINLLTIQKKFKKNFKEQKEELKKLLLKKLLLNPIKKYRKSKKFKKNFKKKYNVWKKEAIAKSKIFPIEVKKPIRGGFFVECFGIKGAISKKQYDFAKKPKHLGIELESNYYKLEVNIPKKPEFDKKKYTWKNRKKFNFRNRKFLKKKQVKEYKKALKKWEYYLNFKQKYLEISQTNNNNTHNLIKDNKTKNLKIKKNTKKNINIQSSNKILTTKQNNIKKVKIFKTKNIKIIKPKEIKINLVKATSKFNPNSKIKSEKTNNKIKQPNNDLKNKDNNINLKGKKNNQQNNNKNSNPIKNNNETKFNKKTNIPSNSKK